MFSKSSQFKCKLILFLFCRKYSNLFWRQSLWFCDILRFNYNMVESLDLHFPINWLILLWNDLHKPLISPYFVFIIMDLALSYGANIKQSIFVSTFVLFSSFCFSLDSANKVEYCSMTSELHQCCLRKFSQSFSFCAFFTISLFLFLPSYCIGQSLYPLNQKRKRNNTNDQQSITTVIIMNTGTKTSETPKEVSESSV